MFPVPPQPRTLRLGLVLCERDTFVTDLSRGTHELDYERTLMFKLRTSDQHHSHTTRQPHPSILLVHILKCCKCSYRKRKREKKADLVSILLLYTLENDKKRVCKNSGNSAVGYTRTTSRRRCRSSRIIYILFFASKAFYLVYC